MGGLLLGHHFEAIDVDIGVGLRDEVQQRGQHSEGRGSRERHSDGARCACLNALGLFLSHPPDRVFLLAVNDVMALGAIAALRTVGLAVPDDVLVAGFDDIPSLQDFIPRLTTVRLPLELIGEKAAELALAADGHSALQIEGEIRIRDSTG